METRKQLKNKIWLIFPILQWGLSFAYERLIFKWNENSWDIFLSKSLDDRFSNTFQSIMLYICGKIVAGIIILLIWKGIFGIIQKKVPKKILIVFGSVVLVVGTFLVFCWPWSFDWEDTYTLYAYSVRMIPWYWHHYLTSAFFVGSMMVIPVPFAMSVIQFMSFAVLISYVYYRIDINIRVVLPLKLLVFVIFLFPGTYLLLTQAYRNCFYTILCMYYVSEICFKAVDERNSHNEKKAEEIVGGVDDRDKYIELSILVLIGALLSVWRTEGILIGVVGTAIIVFKLYKLPIKEKLIAFIGFFVAVMVLSLPQKIGDIKYYNKDYLIMSTVEGLQAVLNSSSANLSYEGAENDLAAINEYVPINYIKQYGIVGKRSWFYENGNMDFDQSCASDEIQSNYLKAVIRIVWHNPVPYVKKQINYTLMALEIKRSFIIEAYNGPDTGGNDVQYTVHKVGYDEVYGHSIVARWINSKAYNTVGMKIHEINSLWKIYFEKLRITKLVRLGLLILSAALVIFEAIKYVCKKRERHVFGILVFLLLVQYLIIAMTVPSGYTLYFYSVFFPCAMVLFIYVLDFIGGKKGGAGV